MYRPTKTHANGPILNRAAFAWLVLAASVPALAFGPEDRRDDRSLSELTCESTGQRTYCAADTRGGVVIKRKLSRAACTQGVSWGYDRRGIWVDRSCRAEFTVSGYSFQGREQIVAPGTNVTVRTNESIDARKNDGLIYSATVTQDVRDDHGAIAIPRGSKAELICRATRDGDLILDLESVTVNGQRYSVSVDPAVAEADRREGIGANDRTAKYVGGGALLGTIIGAIAGGGKGAAIGAIAGAGAGAAGQVSTRGKRVRIPAESEVTFRLDEPFYIGIADNGYNRGSKHYHYPDTVSPDDRR